MTNASSGSGQGKGGTATAGLLLEERLERLSRLHATGALDDGEFRQAKAAVLAEPAAGSATPPVPPPGPGVFAFLAIMLAFAVGCVSSVFVGLQGPAGPFVCGEDRMVAGQTVERHGSETSYNIHTTCVQEDGAVRSVSGMKVFFVLWGLYLAPSVAFVFGLRAIIRRRMRRTRAAAGPGAPGGFPVIGPEPPPAQPPS